MFSEYSRYSNYINVPCRLLKRYRNDKRMWDLLVFAVCLKLNNTSSGMYIRTPRDVMRVCHCSYRKAERLIKQSTSCEELFRYNSKTQFLTAKSFKIGCDWFWGKSNKRMYDDSVVIADKESDGSISHHKISLRLRDDMMRKAIMNNRPRMSCYCQPNSRPEAKKPLTQKYLGNIAGCHRSTVSRHLRKQEKVKAISITSFDKIPVYDIEHGEVINDIPNRRPFISAAAWLIPS